MKLFIDQFRALRPDGQVIFTVSPVPLVATASDTNVIVATSYSKSVLRAAAGALADELPYVDYFPSFEIIASTPMRSMFFEPDMRNVNNAGVEHVMKQFFSQHQPPEIPNAQQEIKEKVERADLICDEMLLEIAETVE